MYLKDPITAEMGFFVSRTGLMDAPGKLYEAI